MTQFSNQAQVMFWMKGQCQQFSWEDARRIGPTYSLGVLVALENGWEDLCTITRVRQQVNVLEFFTYDIIQLPAFHCD